MRGRPRSGGHSGLFTIHVLLIEVLPDISTVSTLALRRSRETFTPHQVCRSGLVCRSRALPTSGIKCAIYGLERQCSCVCFCRSLNAAAMAYRNVQKKQPSETAVAAGACLILGYLICWTLQVPAKPRVSVRSG